MLSREQSKGECVDKSTGNGGPRFPWDDQTEVTSLADGESVVVVQSQLDHGNWVLSVQSGVVEPILAGDVAVTLDQPEDGLHGVVQVQLEAVAGGDGQSSLQVHGELLLHLSNQVLVRQLGEAATLVSVQEHVVHIPKTTVSSSWSL